MRKTKMRQERGVGGVRWGRLTGMLVLAVLALAGCQDIDLTDEDSSSSSTSAIAETVIPTGHGLGTQECPLTPDDILDGITPQDYASCWVAGYAVGSAYGHLSASIFELPLPSDYTTSLLLASDSLCSDVDQCIPVNLASTSVKSTFSLVNYPEGYRQLVVLCGTFAPYFNRDGLHPASQGYWILGFDLSLIAPKPLEWGSQEFEF